jgi:hypothetical protein
VILISVEELMATDIETQVANDGVATLTLAGLSGPSG